MSMQSLSNAHHSIETKIPQILTAEAKHTQYAEEVCQMIEAAAKIRGTGIAKRDPEYIRLKMTEQKAVIALTESGKLAGFCYIETWEHGKYVAHSGLIVHEEFRAVGLAKLIKRKAFELSRTRFPEAKIFGLTTSLPVMKINSELGYKPVTFSELTQDETFWKGCQSCVNYDILTRTRRKHCLCTGMLYENKPTQAIQESPASPKKWKYPMRVYARWMRYKQNILLKLKRKSS